MSDETPRIRLNGEEYEIPMGLTLGEQRAIKRVSGMRWEDVQNEIEHGDPDAVVAFLFAVLRRKHPERSETSLVAEIEALADADIQTDVPDDQEGEGLRPPPGSSGSLNPETTPAGSGIPVSASPATFAPATWPI